MKPSFLLLTSLVSTSAFFTPNASAWWPWGSSSTATQPSIPTSGDISAASHKPAAVQLDFVNVTDPGNLSDDTGYGAVADSFKIGKYDITATQYCAFLNAVAKEDTYGLYDERMSSDADVASIDRSGTPGNYSYSVKAGAGQLPIVYVSWFSAARFCNWMQNGQLSGAQTAATTETGAYTLNGAVKDINGDVTTAPSDYCNLTAGAKYYIPSENQYYKAAYYNRNANNPDYYNYATVSDIAPGNGNEGDGYGSKNVANYFISANSQYSHSQLTGFAWNAKSTTFNAQYTTGGKQPYLTEVGHFSNTVSPYGAYDMAGDVSQWLTSPAGTVGSSRPIRGGCWGAPPLNAADQSNYDTLSKSGQLYKFVRTDEKGQCMQGDIQLHRKNSMVIDGSVKRDYIGFRLAAPL